MGRMDVLPLNFRTLWFCGIWYEESEKLTIARQIYRLAVITLVFYFTFTLTAELFVGNNGVNELTEVLFVAVTYLTMCMKILNFIFRRDEMIEILNVFRHRHSQPADEEESAILKKHSKTARNMFIYLMLFVMSNVFHFILTFVLKLFKNVQELPYKAYQVYNITSDELFFSTAFVQVTSALYSVLINISFDTLTAGLLILSTAQLELNSHRLSKLGPTNVHSLKDYIAHNVLINGCVEKIETFIIGVVIPFLFFSLLSVCTSIFQISKFSIVSAEFMVHITFAVGILLQVLIYCWFGNELMLQSESVANAIYKSDWILLRPEDRRTLHMIMICNKEGKTLSYGGQCTLTLDTFVWILKTSYAAVSLLQQINS